MSMIIMFLTFVLFALMFFLRVCLGKEVVGVTNTESHAI